ncbi:MAG: hypothetical protein NT003_00715 [Candidatus Magasanikbacteria bacterium]|nr:hypothetical protein [Candidatus Magasanikbacteria bacterium]
MFQHWTTARRILALLFYPVLMVRAYFFLMVSDRAHTREFRRAHPDSWKQIADNEYAMIMLYCERLLVWHDADLLNSKTGLWFRASKHLKSADAKTAWKFHARQAELAANYQAVEARLTAHLKQLRTISYKRNWVHEVFVAVNTETDLMILERNMVQLRVQCLLYERSAKRQTA